MFIDPKHIIVGFYGGPLDGWCDERETDETVALPEKLVSIDAEHPGEYEIYLHCPRHWIYSWNEGARAEA